jgi:hypothetical protein
VRTGLEPATLGVTGRYSNQLNYRTNIQQRCKNNRFFNYAKQFCKIIKLIMLSEKHSTVAVLL